MLAFNPEDTVAANENNMIEAMQSVRAGQVTYAVRSTQVDGFDLKEGDIIGINSKEIVAKGESVNKVTEQLIDRMMDKDTTTVTLYFGNNVTEDEANGIASVIAEKYPRCDVDTYFGGQPLYYYIVSLE